jgi:hypothetical protein
MPTLVHLTAALPVLLVMGFVCVLLWGIALVAALGARVPRDAVIVQGVVIGFTQYRGRRRHGSSRTMYSPVYRVTLPNGQTIESGAASSISKSWQSPPVGTHVPLYYSPHGGKSALSETGLQRYLGPIILVAVGAIVGGIGLVVSARIALGH